MEPLDAARPPSLRRSPATSHGPDDPDIDALLHAVGRGDVRALRALYDTTAPAVFGLLRDVLAGQESAERATERVYVQIWRAAPRFDPGTGSARSVLRRAVHDELAQCFHTNIAAASAEAGTGHPRDGVRRR